jgi:hypothetical protein
MPKKNYLLNRELPPGCKCKSPVYAIVEFPSRLCGFPAKTIFAFEDGSSVTDEEMIYYLNELHDCYVDAFDVRLRVSKKDCEKFLDYYGWDYISEVHIVWFHFIQELRRRRNAETPETITHIISNE